MSDMQYAYAVARIRSKELSLLNTQVLEQLLASKSYEDCLHLLHDRGWGGSDGRENSEQLLQYEREKTWNLIRELVDDMSIFDVFLYANDYHNLKAAIKLVYENQETGHVFIDHGTVDPQVIFKAVKEHDDSLLPEQMRKPAKEAFETLLHTGDGQLCDFILDKASLDAIYSAGSLSKNELLKTYAEVTVAAADIKIAVRACRTGKSFDLILRALAQCDSLDIQELARAAAQKEEAIYDCLGKTVYADAVEALRQSPSAFERWCDNAVIRAIRPQLYNPFTVAPLAAYILARENEIKAVRLILSGKMNHLPEQSIRERLREMYV